MITRTSKLLLLDWSLSLVRLLLLWLHLGRFRWSTGKCTCQCVANCVSNSWSDRYTTGCCGHLGHQSRTLRHGLTNCSWWRGNRNWLPLLDRWRCRPRRSCSWRWRTSLSWHIAPIALITWKLTRSQRKAPRWKVVRWIELQSRERTSAWWMYRLTDESRGLKGRTFVPHVLLEFSPAPWRHLPLYQWHFARWHNSSLLLTPWRLNHDSCDFWHQTNTHDGRVTRTLAASCITFSHVRASASYSYHCPKSTQPLLRELKSCLITCGSLPKFQFFSIREFSPNTNGVTPLSSCFTHLCA